MGAGPPMNCVGCEPLTCKSAQAEHTNGLEVTVGTKADGGKQVKRLGSHRTSRDHPNSEVPPEP